MLLDVIQTGPLQVNTYILKDSELKEAVIIDVGGSFYEIYKSLNNENYKIKFILNTHGHFDHILGESEISKNYPEIPIYMHKDDLYHLENLQKELLIWGCNNEVEAPQITKFIDENTVLYLGDKKITVLHTPGHSKGSLSYYIDNKLFSGDALFYHSIGRTDFIDGDYNTLINSIKTKLLPLPDETNVYPGHGQKTTISFEKKYNEYLI